VVAGTLDPHAHRRFTLIELLVVITVSAILAGLLLPALGRAKQKAQGIYCLNNHKQLTLAWKMYVDDSHDLLPFATGRPERVYLRGQMDSDPQNPSNWDGKDLVPLPDGTIGPFSAGGWRLYQCVGDLVDPGPTQTMAFLDVREDGASDPSFGIDMTG
jgi:prepilin-type N-terminal cleavage/methylation domain-containing protein